MNISTIKNQFPILQQTINNKLVIYFDSAATTQKPQSVVRAISDYYTNTNASVHRSINAMAEKSTHAFEAARDTVATFINAKESAEIIFTKNTTEALNLIVQSYAKSTLTAGDHVILAITEHHSNIVPWLQLQKDIKFAIDYIPLNEEQELDVTKAKQLLDNPKAKILSIAHASNTLGNINPIETLVSYAQKNGIITVIDAAQSIAHIPIDVQKMNCDFLAFSGHKMYGPTGIGVLYGKREHLDAMPAWQGGGAMISEVSQDAFTVASLPNKFEAGTPNAAGVIGLAAAMQFITSVGWDAIEKHESALTTHLLVEMQNLDFITIYGSKNPKNKLPLIAFTVQGVHGHDTADILSEHGIMIRAGHHCAEPLHKELGVPSTARVSLGIHNTTEEIDATIKALHAVYATFNS